MSERSAEGGSMKITVVGGGSTYTPELLSGLILAAKRLGLEEVCLQDVASERLEPVANFCQRMVNHAGDDFVVRHTTELSVALDGADFVVMQIRVGGQLGRHDDIVMGLERGLIGQETTGVGGFAKALRTVPVALEISKQMDVHCPNAWCLNFTNPSGLVTEALLRHGRDKVVGLCNVPIEMHMEVAKVLERPQEDIELDWVGLNHLGWVRRVLVDGKDVLGRLIDNIEAGVSGPANLPELRYPNGFLRALGMIPSSYVRFFYAPDEMLAMLREKPQTRAQEVMGIEEALFAIYADEREHRLPELLSQRGGAWYSRLAVDVIGALSRPEPTVHIVNTTNGASVAGLAHDASVEVPCWISSEGIEPQPRGDVDPSILGLMQQVKAYERLTIESAMTRCPHKALLALLAHPLVPDVKTAHSVVANLHTRGLLEAL
jgi:6-phospho-beta-glucosidase